MSLFKEAFDSVIQTWQVLRYHRDTLTVMGDEKKASEVVRRSYLVRPMLCEFVADVENAARRILNAEEQRHFFSHYRDRDGNAEQVPHDIKTVDATMQYKLGRHFKAIGLYPVGSYMRPVDIRGRKKSAQEATKEPMRTMSRALAEQNARIARHREEDADGLQTKYLAQREEILKEARESTGSLLLNVVTDDDIRCLDPFSAQEPEDDFAEEAA